MPPKKGGKKGKKGGAVKEAPFPVPRDLAEPAPIDGAGGAIGIDHSDIRHKVDAVVQDLCKWKISEAIGEGDFDLDVSKSGLDELPEEMLDMPWLQVLDLSENKFVNGVIEELEAFPSLRAVNLSTNQLNSLLPPDAVAALPGCLEELNLSQNVIVEIPETAMRLSNLTWLNLRRNLLTTLPPPCLLAWDKLTFLDLRDNKIKALPEEIGGCISLQELLISSNGLESLPASIGNLKALNVLQAQKNSLTALPESLASCTALQLLDVSYNKLTALPPEMFVGLSSLRRFLASSNKIAALPAEIAAMSCLEVLGLGFNQIKSLPDEIGSLSNLREIYMSDNPLTALPASVVGWSSLQEGAFRNAKLKMIPPEVATTAAWAHCRLIDVRGKKKDTCKVTQEFKDGLRGTRMVGTVLAKAKKGKK